ncbi:TRAP transporter small permease [Hwanghaeella sp.]|uniref:TRAP transporter small permease n=1 Tax=Hwanghaeella sp. TaxID=2605943 RepID=UPI003CCB7A5D
MHSFDAIVGRALRGVAIGCLSALFVLLFVNVIARTFRFAGFAWFDEIVQGLFAWMVFVGAAALWREKDHFQVDWIPNMLSAGRRTALKLVTSVLALCFLVAMTWFGAKLTVSANALTPILALPTALFYASIPLSGAIMIAYSLAELVRLVTQGSNSETGDSE